VTDAHQQGDDPMTDETPPEAPSIAIEIGPLVRPLIVQLAKAMLERDGLRAFLAARELAAAAAEFLVEHRASHATRTYDEARALALRVMRAPDTP
jgi:hypothetical protein